MEAMRSLEKTAYSGKLSETGVFLLMGGVLDAQGTSGASVAAPRQQRGPALVTSLTMRSSQPSTFFALWPSTRRYHHTTTHPGLLCAATERSAVAATASGQPGAPNWPYGRGAQQCLPQGCRAWDWPTHPFFDSLSASKQILPYALHVQGVQRRRVGVVEWVGVCT